MTDNGTVKKTSLGFAEKSARHRVEFWASSVDAFLQDFMTKAADDDRLGTIVAAARLAQLTSAMCEEYEAQVTELTESPTEAKVAQQACGLVVKMVNDNGEQCVAMKNAEAALVSAEAPDRTLS